MKFEETPGVEIPYLITFEGVEVEVMQAVYVEDISRCLKKGNTNSFNPFDERLAKWESAEGDKSAHFRDFEDLAQKLEDFGERTDEVTIDMANETAIPDYMKTYLVTRRQLGIRAIELASDIRREGNKTKPPLPQPGTVNIDEELARLFGGAES